MTRDTPDGPMARASLRDGMRLGGGTFTRIPVSPPSVVDASAGRWAMLSAPLWGLLVGGIAGGVAGAMWAWWGRNEPVSPTSAGLCAVVTIVVVAWLSRGLHLDGLADTADGFASMRRGDQALGVMRDPHLGALGAASLALVLLLQVSALTVVIATASPGAVVAVVSAAVLISRAVLPWTVRRGTPAAPDGLGQVVVGSASMRSAVLATGLGAVACMAVLTAAGTPAVFAVATPVAAIGAAVIVRRQAIHRFGAVNGDVLGAVVEVSLTAALMVLALSR